MPSSDQTSGAGSGNVAGTATGKKNSVIPDQVELFLDEVMRFVSSIPPEIINHSNSGNNSGSSHSSQEEHRNMENQVEKLRKDLIFIGRSFENLHSFEDRATDLLEALQQRSSFDEFGTGGRNVATRTRQVQAKLRAISKIVMELKLRIPLPHKLSSKDSDTRRKIEDGTEFDDLEVVDELPVLHINEKFKESSAFNDFQAIYEKLEIRTKLCLLCFALIPESEIVKKRFMTYWWVGEGFVNPSDEKTSDKIFEELVNKNCIEPVNEKQRFAVHSYKMNPLIRSALIVLADKAKFFDFDKKKGNPTANFAVSYRACLVSGSSQKQLRSVPESDPEKQQTTSGSDPETQQTISGSDPEKQQTTPGSDPKKQQTSTELDPEKLQVIFNVNEPYPDFFELEWFSKLRNVKVLYLGRWQTSAKHHIEVESVEFLKGLKNMKLLTFLSLQGISRITEIPDSLCKLSSLRILDLRACHTLEEIPVAIGSLQNLTHLDISECYLLDHMPKGIASLSKLRVLKGFVITDHLSSKSCTLDDLSKLDNLGKLSIYTNRKDFPKPGDVDTLQRFKKLEKLTIEWGAFPTNTDSDSQQNKGEAQTVKETTPSSKKREDKKKPDKGMAQPDAAAIKSPKKSEDKKKQDECAASATGPKGIAKTLSKLSSFVVRKEEKRVPKDFEKLKKLDLKCYPLKEAPDWLAPGKLEVLEKLYIRGGELPNLSPGQENDEWKVKELRLKFLSDFKMDWITLRLLFPHLTYIEKFKCPKLTFFPCNENGVWRKG